MIGTACDSSNHGAGASSSNDSSSNHTGPEGIDVLYTSTFHSLLALQESAEKKLEAAVSKEEVGRAKTGVKNVQKALNKFIAIHRTAEEETPAGRRPDDLYISVLYLVLSIAAGIAPLIAKFGMNRIPYIKGGDWLEGFEPVVTRYATSMKDIIIFRWVCNGPYSKTYEDNLRAKLTPFLVKQTVFEELDKGFLDAINPYLKRGDQQDFRTVMERKNKVHPEAYARSKDAVLAKGPIGFYVNRC